MKSFLYSVLAVAGICAIAACSNGNYIANPSSNANGAANPLNAAAVKYDWPAAPPLSATINDNPFVSDSLTTTFAKAGGYNIVTGIKGGKGIVITFNDDEVGTYSMGYRNTAVYAGYIDSFSTTDGRYQYYSYNALSGGLKITTSNATTLEGYFYFEGANSMQDIENVKNGYFKVNR